MPGVRVLIKGVNKVVEFPENMAKEQISESMARSFANEKSQQNIFGGLKKEIEDIKALTKEHGNVYVRWSVDPNRDLSGKYNSRDFVAGETHNGLSAVEISPDFSDAEIANALAEYGFLRLQNPKNTPKIYKASRVGTDSDSHALIKPEKLLKQIKGQPIKEIDMGAHEYISLQESIQDSIKRMERSDEIGKKIHVENIEKKTALLNKILSKTNVSPGIALAGAGFSAITPEEASAQEAQNLFPNISNQLLSMNQLAKLPSNVRPDVGSIQGPIKGDSDVVAAIQDLGGLLSKFEVPVLGNPVQGLAEYMQNFGYNDSEKERLKRAALAVLDFL